MLQHVQDAWIKQIPWTIRSMPCVREGKATRSKEHLSLMIVLIIVHCSYILSFFINWIHIRCKQYLTQIFLIFQPNMASVLHTSKYITGLIEDIEVYADFTPSLIMDNIYISFDVKMFLGIVHCRNSTIKSNCKTIKLCIISFYLIMWWHIGHEARYFRL